MAGTLKEITENYEKLHRLQMIDTILHEMYSYVHDVVSRVEDDFDDCEDFEDYITENTDGLNWIKIGDVKPNDKYIRKTAEKIIKEGLAKTRQVKKGDFILSNSMSFGRPYILDIDGCIHDGWLVIQDYQEAYDMQFLYYILCSDVIMNQYVSMAAGSGVQNLNKDKVADVLLYAPSSLTELQAIASVLTSMDYELSALEAKRKKYEQIKQGMMQQLLTGRIRLENASTLH